MVKFGWVHAVAEACLQLRISSLFLAGPLWPNLVHFSSHACCLFASVLDVIAIWKNVFNVLVTPNIDVHQSWCFHWKDVFNASADWKELVNVSAYWSFLRSSCNREALHMKRLCSLTLLMWLSKFFSTRSSAFHECVLSSRHRAGKLGMGWAGGGSMASPTPPKCLNGEASLSRESAVTRG